MAKKSTGNKRGAPVKLNDENRIKLKEVAALDGSVEEMAYYCGVSHQTIYNWFDREPELFEEIERLRQKPILLARQRVIKGIGESYSNAMDYLKRKKYKEMGDRSVFTTEDEDGKTVPISGMIIKKDGD